MARYDLTEIATRAMLERNFFPNYNASIEKEIQELKPVELPIEGLQAKDLRELLFCSIDNDDSKDLDQLTYAEDIGGGKYKLYIAVALVDSLVKKGSAIDDRAEHNTTSVYTPTKVFSMLPEKLSTNLTSLNADVDRIAMIFEGTYEPSDIIHQYDIYLGYVHNHAQLAYDSLSSWFEGNGPLPSPAKKIPGLDKQLLLQEEIAQHLAAFRAREGQLSLETIEPKTVLQNGEPVNIVESKSNRAKKLIEHFMIFANMISARYSDKNKLLSLHRVVVVPKRWDKIVEIAREKGEVLPETPNSAALDQFLLKQKKKEPDVFPDLSLTIVKLLGSGEYKVGIPGEPVPGHFGLALREYTHSTAPNRRFPDLITQRMIIANLLGLKMPYDLKQLESLASHCTRKEDDAEKVERRMRKSAAALVLSKSIGQEFKGVVTGAGEKGTWVRIFTPPVEGKLTQIKRSVDVGDHIRVKLVHTDVENGFIDFVAI